RDTLASYCRVPTSRWGVQVGAAYENPNVWAKLSFHDCLFTLGRILLTRIRSFWPSEQGHSSLPSPLPLLRKVVMPGHYNSELRPFAGIRTSLPGYPLSTLGESAC